MRVSAVQFCPGPPASPRSLPPFGGPSGTIISLHRVSTKSGQAHTLDHAVSAAEALVQVDFCHAVHVDGIEVAQDTQPDLGGSDNGLYIGCGKAMEPGTYWSGLIDDVRIYNRVVIP